MTKLLFSLTLTLCLGTLTFAQTEEREKEKSINKEWQRTLQDVEKSLQEIEIPDIDIDRIMDEVKDAMPTREEMESYKAAISDAVHELKKIDLSELERALEDLRVELDDIFGNNPEGNPKKEKIGNTKKI